MITVGLVKEILWIATALKTDVDITIHLKYDLKLKVTKNNLLYLKYNNIDIWSEVIEGDTSMFGVESCSNISIIINHIDVESNDWKNYSYFNK